MYSDFFKRFIDITLSLFFLIIISPLFIIIAILLFILNHESPFYFQNRPGKDGTIFSIIKFKTMNDKYDIFGKILPDMHRVTPIGKFIRGFSFDEFPQLINVLKGDMSLIGPRPLLINYLPLYNSRQARRHEVKPGMTGWAQINGRNTLSWEDRFELDVWYVDNISFLLDLRIFFITIFKVIKREGINLDSQKTMDPFLGNIL